MPEPLTMTIISAISGVLGVGAKGWELYKQVKADSVRSDKKLLVQLASAQKRKSWSKTDDAEKSIQEVYGSLAEAKPFVTDLYRRQAFTYSVWVACISFVLVFFFASLLAKPWLWGIGDREVPHRGYSAFSWVFPPLAFGLAWFFSSKVLPSIEKLKLQGDLISMKNLASGWEALRKAATDLTNKTQEQFATQRRLLGFNALSAFETSFLKAYIELSCMVRSLELQALYLQFRKSSEAVHDYLSGLVLAQISEMVMAMVEGKVLKPKPQIDVDAKWERDQKTLLTLEFKTGGMEKYLEVVDPSFWTTDFTQYSYSKQSDLNSKLKSCFPSFSERETKGN